MPNVSLLTSVPLGVWSHIMGEMLFVRAFHKFTRFGFLPIKAVVCMCVGMGVQLFWILKKVRAASSC